MTENLAPDLLTTHNYLARTLDPLSDEGAYELRDSMTTLMLPANDEIAVPHQFMGQHITPLQEDKDGVTRRRGVRELSLSLWTAPQPREGLAIQNEVPSHYKISEDTIRHCLGTTVVWYNTQRVLDIDGEIYGAGAQYGLSALGLQEATDQNPIFNLFGNLVELGTINLERVVRMVQAASLVYGGRSLYCDAEVDIDATARSIREQTGKPIPKSLQALPAVYRESEERFGPRGENSIVVSAIQIDNYDEQNQRRTITDWTETSYQGFVPVELQHLAEYSQITPEGEPTDQTMGIDVVQTVLGSPNEVTVAQTAEEARAMAAPLIRAMTNLRRYYNAANKQAA